MATAKNKIDGEEPSKSVKSDEDNVLREQLQDAAVHISSQPDFNRDFSEMRDQPADKGKWTPPQNEAKCPASHNEDPIVYDDAAEGKGKSRVRSESECLAADWTSILPRILPECWDKACALCRAELADIQGGTTTRCCPLSQDSDAPNKGPIDPDVLQSMDEYSHTQVQICYPREESTPKSQCREVSTDNDDPLSARVENLPEECGRNIQRSATHSLDASQQSSFHAIAAIDRTGTGISASKEEPRTVPNAGSQQRYVSSSDEAGTARDRTEKEDSSPLISLTPPSIRPGPPIMTKAQLKEVKKHMKQHVKAAKKQAKLEKAAAKPASRPPRPAPSDPPPFRSPPPPINLFADRPSIGLAPSNCVAPPGTISRPSPDQGDGHYSEEDVERHSSRDQSHPLERVRVTEQDDETIRRKTDKVILAILVWVYFLQILDKSVLGYGSIFGLQEDTGLAGNQYSLVGSIAPIAQLAWQPFSSILIVKVPHRTLMPLLVLGWGIAQTSMAACHNYSGLLATRFFLGLFEAGCLPLFSVITNQWYRRSEQPLRVAAWYGTNGLATIVASALSYGLGHIPSETLRSWQIIFLFVGCVTIITAPFVYWKLDNDIASARFLTEHEKAQAVERLRANQTGIGSRAFEWDHLYELFLEPKTYLWFAMALLLNVGASVTNTFGPLILKGFGFDKYITSLLNMPFGLVQLLIILISSYAAQKARIKSIILLLLVIPVIAGLATLYVISRGNQPGLLTGYYLLAFLFGANPLIISWIIGNTAGTTKKSIIMSLYNAGSSTGNIIGPLLFNSHDAPSYFPGLRAVLAIFVALAAIVILQICVLRALNSSQAKKRVRNGKARYIGDASMEERYMEIEDRGLGQHAFDLTDGKNDEFVYIY